MAIPQEILEVERPKNTVVYVTSSGKYGVKKRIGCKRMNGKNIPINGPTIGHIINGEYEGDEEERVIKAGEILESSPLYVEELPDFSLKDVENVIKKNIRDHDVKYIFHD